MENTFVVLVKRPKKGKMVVGTFPSEEYAKGWVVQAMEKHPKWVCRPLVLTDSYELYNEDEDETLEQWRLTHTKPTKEEVDEATKQLIQRALAVGWAIKGEDGGLHYLMPGDDRSWFAAPWMTTEWPWGGRIVTLRYPRGLLREVEREEMKRCQESVDATS